REEDGLALSSRNSFITADERPRVNVLYNTLCWIRNEIQRGNREYIALSKEGRARIEEAGFRTDYLQVCNSRTLLPAAHDDAELTILGAIYTEAARLIDNLSLQVAPAPLARA